MRTERGVNSQDYIVNLVCKNLECGKEFNQVDVSTGEFGLVAHVCDACGCESLYEKDEY